MAAVLMQAVTSSRLWLPLKMAELRDLKQQALPKVCRKTLFPLGSTVEFNRTIQIELTSNNLTAVVAA